MKWRPNLVKYLTELLIVAFGVFLGMLLSTYQKNKGAEENVLKATDFIIQELKQNEKRLEASMEYHQKIRRSYDSIQQHLTPSVLTEKYFDQKDFQFNKMKGWHGLGMASMQDIAYESAKVSGVFQDMGFEQVQIIATQYKMIASYNEFSKAMMEKLLSVNSETRVLDVVMIFELLFNDVLNTENLIKIEIEKSFEKLRAIQKK